MFKPLGGKLNESSFISIAAHLLDLSHCFTLFTNIEEWEGGGGSGGRMGSGQSVMNKGVVGRYCVY